MNIDHRQPNGARTRQLLIRFRASRKGATAVEFALLAIPFLFMLMMLFEMAMVFWTRQVLQETTAQASRSILTGESKTLYTGSAAVQTAAFRDAICAKMSMAPDCGSRLFVDVQPLGATFPAALAASMISGGAINPASFQMRPVAPLEIAIVRVAYKMPTITAGFFSGMSKLTTGENVLQSVIAFQAEPYVAP